MSESNGFSSRAKLAALGALVAFSAIVALLGRTALKDSSPFFNASAGAAAAKTSAGNFGVEANGTIMPEFVEIPAGSFMMGAADNDGSIYEQPQHQVAINKFLISRFEITNAQYMAFCRATKREPLPDPLWGENYIEKHPDHPVVMIRWEDAEEYCKWLSSVTGRIIRLPTEAEWEYASQGSSPGTTNEEAHNNLIPTTKAGTHKPNPYGLYDMLGNAAEWCLDWYEPTYYSVSPSNNPRGPESGKYRVIRGGSWTNRVDRMSFTARGHAAPEGDSPTIGFRVVMDAQ